jgi:hypothetical protein
VEIMREEMSAGEDLSVTFSMLGEIGVRGHGAPSSWCMLIPGAWTMTPDEAQRLCAHRFR